MKTENGSLLPRRSTILGHWPNASWGRRRPGIWMNLREYLPRIWGHFLAWWCICWPSRWRLASSVWVPFLDRDMWTRLVAGIIQKTMFGTNLQNNWVSLGKFREAVAQQLEARAEKVSAGQERRRSGVKRQDCVVNERARRRSRFFCFVDVMKWR